MTDDRLGEGMRRLRQQQAHERHLGLLNGHARPIEHDTFDDAAIWPNQDAYREPPPDDHGASASLGEPVAKGEDRPKFKLVPFREIAFDTTCEWRVKHLIPRVGVGAFYGSSEAYKSFLAYDLSMHVALGWPWAGRRTVQGPTVYIACEGARGMCKRKAGFELAHDNLPDQVPFHLVEAAPNLGTAQGDLQALIASIEQTGIKPAMIAIDTLAQALGGGDENGAGMVQFLSNATALAAHFECFVLIIHHVGLGDDQRLRGHSSLRGGLDVQILCEAKRGSLEAKLTCLKQKDEDSTVTLAARLSRIVIGHDEDGDEISTLVVTSIENAAPGKSPTATKPVPRSRRLLMSIIGEAIAECGENFYPHADGPMVRAVPDDLVRRRYYLKIAEKIDPDEDPRSRADRQKKAFKRAVNAELDAKTLNAAIREGERMLWLP